MKNTTFHANPFTLIGIGMLLMGTSFSYAKGIWQLRKHNEGIKVYMKHRK